MPEPSSKSIEVRKQNRSLRRFAPKYDRPAESGYVLIGVLFLVFLFTLSLTIAVPQMAKSIQRDREMETIQRGKAYIRAIRLYYKVFGKYPTSIDELEKANNIRFLRRRYLDPMTGKDDWRLIHMGEATVPSLGLFGVPLGIGASSLQAGALGQTIGQPGGQSGNQADPAQPTTPAIADASATTPAPGLQNSVPANAPTSPGQSPSSSDSTGSTGVVMGQIVGVGVPVNKSSLLNFKKQNNYSHWEFVYDPRQDQQQFPNAAGQGVNPPSPGVGDPIVSTPQASPGDAPQGVSNGEPVVTPISNAPSPQ